MTNLLTIPIECSVEYLDDIDVSQKLTDENLVIKKYPNITKINEESQIYNGKYS